MYAQASIRERNMRKERREHGWTKAVMMWGCKWMKEREREGKSRKLRQTGKNGLTG